MKIELSWKVAAPILALIVGGLVYFGLRAFGEQTVPASAIKSPPPPGGYPTGPRANR